MHRSASKPVSPGSRTFLTIPGELRSPPSHLNKWISLRINVENLPFSRSKMRHTVVVSVHTASPPPAWHETSRLSQPRRERLRRLEAEPDLRAADGTESPSEPNNSRCPGPHNASASAKPDCIPNLNSVLVYFY